MDINIKYYIEKITPAEMSSLYTYLMEGQNMKSFKWHGIPVNLPNKKSEWIALGVLLGSVYVAIGLVIVFKQI